MSNEVMTCPLSGCFLGMSPAQAEAASTLRFSDIAGRALDRRAATKAYEALPAPSDTADREPTFLDRMLRRVSRSPLSRKGGESAAETLVATLRAHGVLEGAADLTRDRDELLHGQLIPPASVALRELLAEQSFDSMSVAARIAALCDAYERPSASREVSTRAPHLCARGQTVIYLPVTLSRVVEGEPHDVGSTRALRLEIETIADALGLARADCGVRHDADTAPEPLALVASDLDMLARACDSAERHGRVVVRSS